MKPRIISKCIYCFKSDVELSDEHVMPKALGGQATLQRASCKDCADITSKIIRKITKGEKSIFGKARVVLGMPSRRSAQQPINSIQEVVDHTTRKLHRRSVPTKELIDSILLPIYPLPGVISGIKSTEIHSNEAQLINANHSLAELNKTYLSKHKGDVRDLALLLALIAYCHCVYEFGLDAVADSPLRLLILGFKKDLGTWVGTATDYQLRQINKLVDVAHAPTKNGNVLVRIKFFAWLKEVPEYLVATTIVRQPLF